MIADLSLYLVTDPDLCGERGVVETVRRAVDGGVRIVQLRDKTATDIETTAQLVELSRVIDGRALLLVNDRLDSALAARERGARVDGVHLGQGDASVSRAREVLGAEAVIGLTANSPEHLEAVRALPPGTVDYLGVGVIRPTATKADHPPALGVEGFRAVVETTALPCVAIGGVGIDDTERLRSAGAAGLAVVSALCAAADPAETAEAFVRRWRAAGTPRVLSIAGSDPSGGAGIQADLKSIAANGGYGMAALTALTAQNTTGVRGVHVPPAAFLRDQLDAISDDIVIDAVKVGMLANADVIRTVADWLDVVRPPIVVLDPVMVATSGDRLLDRDAEAALRELLRRAHVVTPNLSELSVLAGRTISGWDDALAAAEELSTAIGAAVLVKGGHLDGDDVPDALVDTGAGVRCEYPGRRIRTANTHGTGCSLSSALATRLARGESAVDAVAATRAWLREALRESTALNVGRGHGPVSHFAGLWERGRLETRPTPEQIRAEWWTRTVDVRAGIDELPFIRGLADGTLAREPFVFYLAQDALYLREYARVLAEASRLAPSPHEQAFWARSAEGAIVGELELHASWLTPGEDVDAAMFSVAPAPATVAYLDHLRSVAFGGDYAELIAAILPCFWLYTDLGQRLHAGEFGASALDPLHPYASWLATYADPAFEDATAEAISLVTAAAATAAPATRDRMLRAFEVSSAHELAFFAAPLASAVTA
ncbi:bifunctional hydroxymethylpyrimidine kinase/phosphomethylpyrimidine kinase [Microbacterium foliorum]|uniref:bifunctional hydroxymethylpyrimidine kinase/phosphomethylpyrimidine kinase n=1 Tax=Microbacterium foliorum TaxID=104336 RepID=UPI001DBDBBEE|nr:bifunctional hydroxymethylpyrimidine kinase/phosphomethylpyrimidine kinase [Microbacterium foliorum]CAH0241460.1 Hydroxymethylpyrimidine/phosphomethylpyrimidine kinase [Microbacterium foliorum]CAH0244823.1 Hydroxymethylpyrimidine/phosphomethylpyrimidine kinase [Microbacterium foliorum]